MSPRAGGSVAACTGDRPGTDTAARDTQPQRRIEAVSAAPRHPHSNSRSTASRALNLPAPCALHCACTDLVQAQRNHHAPAQRRGHDSSGEDGGGVRGGGDRGDARTVTTDTSISIGWRRRGWSAWSSLVEVVEWQVKDGGAARRPCSAAAAFHSAAHRRPARWLSTQHSHDAAHDREADWDVHHLGSIARLLAGHCETGGEVSGGCIGRPETTSTMPRREHTRMNAAPRGFVLCRGLGLLGRCSRGPQEPLRLLPLTRSSSFFCHLSSLLISIPCGASPHCHRRSSPPASRPRRIGHSTSALSLAADATRHVPAASHVSRQCTASSQRGDCVHLPCLYAELTVTAAPLCPLCQSPAHSAREAGVGCAGT